LDRIVAASLPSYLSSTFRRDERDGRHGLQNAIDNISRALIGAPGPEPVAQDSRPVFAFTFPFLPFPSFS
jgi:hypothetical protein